MTILVVILVGVLALCGGMVIGDRGRQREQKRLAATEAARQLSAAPLNVFGNIVLPDPADPRWRQTEKQSCFVNNGECGGVVLVMGRVRACYKHGVYVDGLDLGRIHNEERAKKYVHQVREDYMARVAQEEIDATMPFHEEPEQLVIS